MPKLVRNAIRWALKRAGYDIIPFDPNLDFDDFDLRQEDADLGILSRVGPYTMTSRARVSALCRAVEYVVRSGIVGDIVECGVWKGGSMMAAALRLQQLSATDRRIYLFDTFEGMTAPTEHDADLRTSASEWMASETKKTGSSKVLFQSLETVRGNMETTGYPRDKIVYVKGPVEQTLPANAPEKISILRLDTDFYESTRHELETLYPRLSVGGVLILDDYNFWKGAKKAVDEFIQSKGLRILLNRIDHSSRVAIKLEP
jgi:O-methyltransferase